ncbi:MAG: hypothetical protein GKS06_15480 [Acidobacteria bacterium]|nr:hypothetical protein [Acidobacteriota bacterium]
MPWMMVVLAASAAAGATALGILPLRSGRPASRWMAWSSALAGGLMIAASFALVESVPRSTTLQMALGAVAGIGVLHLARVAIGARDIRLHQLDAVTDTYGRNVLRVGMIHAAAEGAAIGAAMAQDIAFGVFVAVALALHNVPEGTLLGAVLQARGASLQRAAVLGVAANSGQVILALGTYLALLRWPAGLALLLGFAAGALVYLVLVDLLPDAYEGAGAKSIALTVVLALWTFGLLHGVLRG